MSGELAAQEDSMSTLSDVEATCWCQVPLVRLPFSSEGIVFILFFFSRTETIRIRRCSCSGRCERCGALSNIASHSVMRRTSVQNLTCATGEIGWTDNLYLEMSVKVYGTSVPWESGDMLGCLSLFPGMGVMVQGKIALADDVVNGVVGTFGNTCYGEEEGNIRSVCVV